MFIHMPRAIYLAALLPLSAASLRANVTLPTIFSDHAVLQKSDRVPLWGRAEAGEKVTVTINQAKASVIAGADGKWRVELNLKSEGQGPYELIVNGANQLTVKDVVIGEVWLCSGQSNMELTLDKTLDAEQEIRHASNPSIRQFHAADIASPTPLDDNPGKWEIASPETVARFTAVGYYFGKRLQHELNTPVGLIHSSWGGTPIEAWTSAEALQSIPDLNAGAAKAIANFRALEDYAKNYATWAEKFHRKDHPIPTSLDSFINSESPTSDWKRVMLPAKFSEIGLPDAGAVWLRKKVVLPSELTKQPVHFKFGEYRDTLTVFWNGAKIFHLDPFGVGHGPTAWVPQTENNLVIRIDNPSTGMGILPGREFSVAEKIPLQGEWLAKVEYKLPALEPEAQAALPLLPNISRPLSKQNVATYLFNGMIHPFIPYAIAGVIWYQGESNADRAFQYRQAFPLLISDWRKQWGQGDFPFYYCQLANFMPHRPAGESAWAELREAQNKTLSVPNTGQAVLIDLGEEGDIHPRNKKEVGERLARIALAKTYGKPVAYSGPTYESMVVEGNKIRIKFSNASGGLVARPFPSTYAPKSLQPERRVPLLRNSPESEVEGFVICGEDRAWVWADASIQGNEVLLSARSVHKPVAARYGWADNPLCNLYNQEGLPAGPFRTDSFPCTTEKNRY